MIAKIGAFFRFFLFIKLSYFCDKHLISFEDNTISQILIFHTALLLSPSCFLFYSFFLFIFFCLLFLHISSPTFRTSPLLSGHISHICSSVSIPHIILVQAACVRHPWRLTEAKRAIVFTSFFSFFFLRLLLFTKLPWLKICLPQYFGINRRNMGG